MTTGSYINVYMYAYLTILLVSVSSEDQKMVELSGVSGVSEFESECEGVSTKINSAAASDDLNTKKYFIDDCR